MKRLLGLLIALSVLLGGVMGLQVDAAIAATGQSFSNPSLLLAAELRNAVDDKLSTAYGSKLDINNANVQAFTKYPGLYPTIAGKIVQNAPYESIDELLAIPGLSDREKALIEDNMDEFAITPPDPALVEGADRFNNGVYR
ncbi:MAG: photosystem II complex extrinsic protein PsbU [Cyanobacteria bacterium]|nr:photosystem II complex extrinsic protein PsbU [Cyanobacteriota bacterium]